MNNEIKAIKNNVSFDEKPKVDSGYLGSGIGALEECTRTCIEQRQPIVQVLIGQAYYLLNMRLKAYEHFLQAQ